jgi:hypothetical protein
MPWLKHWTRSRQKTLKAILIRSVFVSNALGKRYIQADVGLLDAEFFAPFIVRALADAQHSADPTLAALGRDPGVVEAGQAAHQMGLHDAHRHPGGLRRKRRERPPAPAEQARDRRQRRRDHLRDVARAVREVYHRHSA